MGCAGSKQMRRDRRRSPSPLARSYSMPVHHPALSKGDSCHVVALTSTTLGSIRLDDVDEDDDGGEPMKKTLNDKRCGAAAEGGGDFAVEVTKAKALSEMIERRIPPPRTPTETPPNEPEVINTWEMMAALEDVSPLYRITARGGAAVERSISFHSVHETGNDTAPKTKSKLTNGSVSPEPMWMQVDPNGGDAIITDFDPDVISAFRKAIEELSPKHPFHLRSQTVEKLPLQSQPDEPEKLAADQNQKVEDAQKIPDPRGIVQARVHAFQKQIDAKKSRIVALGMPRRRPPGGEGKVVFYFTSLRGIRKTYEDCCSVRLILRGYAVRVDERDVSMHGEFKDELNAILGPGYGGSRLPRVFGDGRYLGGAEEVRQMHDAGDLWEALEGCEEVEQGKEASCHGCGDVRFVPCETCSGSCKVYVEEEDDREVDRERGKGDVEYAGFRRCPDCNENGLVRCPLCCNN